MNKQQLKKLEDDLWRAADSLRANSDLKASEYSTPVLGLIFLKFADNKYRQYEDEILAEHQQLRGTRRAQRSVSDIAVAKCGFYLPDHARYDYLLNLPENRNIANAIKEAMKAIEEYTETLEGVLPRNEYARVAASNKEVNVLKQLLRIFADIPADTSGDMFGQIYEYFLGEFAMSEGQGGGEFFTPRSVVRLMVEVIQPHGGKVFDPACGSGGMFVQSAQFIEQHRRDAADRGGIYVYGQEKTMQTVKLARMNLAVNGLRGEVQQANTYYEDPHGSFGKFDYVLANPPFNVDDVSLSSVEHDRRFNTYGLPRNKTKLKKKDAGKETVPNGNYLWISLFATSLKKQGRAALVMANSASDARHSEADIRKNLIEQNLIYGMLTLPSNMFYTVTLPATLWFFDKGKSDDRILFIDARNVFTQIDRAHREFSDEQVRNLALISALHRGQRHEFIDTVEHYFAQGFAKLAENRGHIEPLCERLLDVLDDADGKDAVAGLVKEWAGLNKLQNNYQRYRDQHAETESSVAIGGSSPATPDPSTSSPSSPDTSSPSSPRRRGSKDVESSAAATRDNDKRLQKHNTAQHTLRTTCDPFFAALHEDLKRLDRLVRQHDKRAAGIAKADGKRGGSDRDTRALKTALDALHAEVKTAETWFAHIRWLQDRFPQAAYEDVTGLCKLATPAEVREQDYSLNPGRYVGVVIEEDGKSEEEFITELWAMNEEFAALNVAARKLERVISKNVISLAGEE